MLHWLPLSRPFTGLEGLVFFRAAETTLKPVMQSTIELQRTPAAVICVVASGNGLVVVWAACRRKLADGLSGVQWTLASTPEALL